MITILKSFNLYSSRETTQDSGEEEEFFYYDEEDSLDDFDQPYNNRSNSEPTPVVECDEDLNSASVYESASNSIESSPLDTSTNDDSDDSVFDGENETEDFSSSSSTEKSVSSLVEEDLENKKRLLHSQAKRLLQKNKRLRKNYALTNENIITKGSPLNMWKVNSPVGVRKSLRRRQTSKKLADSDYAMDDELSDSNSESSELVVQAIEINSNESSKGELKLRIKRVGAGSAVVQNEMNTSPCLISPDARVTRRTAAILKNSPIVHKGVQQTIANLDDENEMKCLVEIDKDLGDSEKSSKIENESVIDNKEMVIPKSVKTLAEIRKQIFKKKRTSDEMSSNGSENQIGKSHSFNV